MVTGTIQADIGIGVIWCNRFLFKLIYELVLVLVCELFDRSASCWWSFNWRDFFLPNENKFIRLCAQLHKRPTQYEFCPCCILTNTSSNRNMGHIHKEQVSVRRVSKKSYWVNSTFISVEKLIKCEAKKDHYWCSQHQNY